jgi:hypothetical protein
LTAKENADTTMFGDRGSEMLPLLLSMMAVDGKTSMMTGIDSIK